MKTVKPNGFTIIELLIVVLIISLLLSLLVPAISKIRSHYQLVSCSNNLRQLYITTYNYIEVYNNIPIYDIVLIDEDLNLWNVPDKIWKCPSNINPIGYWFIGYDKAPYLSTKTGLDGGSILDNKPFFCDNQYVHGKYRNTVFYDSHVAFWIKENPE